MITKVAVVFCGGCKPEIDRQQVLRRLQELLPDYTFQFGIDEAEHSNCLLILNGCPTECRTKDFPRHPNCITVRGEMISNTCVAEDAIPRRLAAAIRSCSAGAGEIAPADPSTKGDGTI